MTKKVLAGIFAASSMVLAGDLSTVSAESSGVLYKGGAKGNNGLIYKAENFHTMAALPSFSLGAPSGLVSSYGVAFGGVSGRTGGDDTDGAMALGMGIGDAEKLGGSITLGIGSIDPRDGGSFNRGSLNIALGHHFKNQGLGWSAGVTGLDLWHEDSLDGDKLDPSFYTAVTKLFPNDTAPIALTAGFGNNGYVDIEEDDDRTDKLGVFGSAAVYILPQVSLILDYTTGVLTAGTSLVPFPDYPVTLTLGAGNLNEPAGKEVEFVGALSAAYVF